MQVSTSSLPNGHLTSSHPVGDAAQSSSSGRYLHGVRYAESIGSSMPSVYSAGSSTMEEWTKTQPLSILQLDPADRVVLKIAGNCGLFSRVGTK